MKKIFIAYFSTIFLLTSCINKVEQTHPSIYSINTGSKTLQNLKNWQNLDIQEDSVPGISLNKAYNYLVGKTKSQEVIIAILDRPIDINHKSLKSVIWKNSKELDNNIDDDGNGYKDDIHGWNFLGNATGKVNDIQWADCLRTIQKLSSRFENRDEQSIDSLLFKDFLRAKEDYDLELEEAKKDVTYAKMIRGVLTSTKKTMKTYFPNEDYTLKDLDSLKKEYPKDSLLQTEIIKRHNFMKYGFTEEYITNYEWRAFSRLEKCLNPNFNERELQGDDPNDLMDQYYGNNRVNANISRFSHGTRVAGGLFSFFEKTDSSEPLTPIKIMPVIVSAYGGDHPKDIALGIRYAVDNGAKVINMSFKMDYNDSWVINALKYASINNVLIVKGAGNSNNNLDNREVYDFPDDRDENGNEYVDNLIKVGASSHHLNSELKSNFSSYGKENVDLFAPGENIYTTFPNNVHSFERGTSMSTVITSGVASILFSHYPSLTAPEVKHILMDSGVEYDIMVSVPTKDDPDRMLPFNELSKSGKIVNAYNALLMAEQVVKAKKK